MTLRISRTRGLLAAALVVMVVLSLAPAGASTTQADHETGTVRAIVRHNPGGGLPPVAVPNVEVFVWDGSQAHYECTKANGVAVFSDMPVGSGYISATGPSVDNPRCGNADFLNLFPGDALYGKQMYTVFWNKHKGERVFDSFSVADSLTTTVLFVTSTPPNQRVICHGLKVTMRPKPGEIDGGDNRIVGTADTDVINALGGNDVVLGRDGDDFICGGPGSDYLNGEAGDDMIWGSNGQDTLVGGYGSDWLYGGPQGDRCRTGETLVSCEL